MPNQSEGDGFCFIGGVPRSGLTLLRRLISAHPDILCGSDTGVAPAFAMQASNFITTLGTLHRKDFGLDETQVWRIFGRLAARCLSGEGLAPRFICEKTSLNILVFEELAQMLPQARFIHVVRDGRDVASSLLQRDWRNPQTGEKFAHVANPDAAANYWKALAEIGLKAEASLSAGDRILRVKYEDLVLAPDIAISKIFDFIGAPPPSVRAVAPHEMPVSALEKESLPLLFQPVTAARILIAKHRLPAEIYEKVNAITRPAMMRLGYP